MGKLMDQPTPATAGDILITMRPAAFIDRDDTLIATRSVTAGTDHVGDLLDPRQVELIPGAAEGCRLLSQAGLPLVVVSNQGLVARGRGGLREVEAVNDRLRLLLREVGVELAGLYYCPFHPLGRVPAFKGEHAWRKPSEGMFTAAAAELGLSLSSSWAIGDSPRDVVSAVTAGIPPGHAVVIGKGPGIFYRDLVDVAKVVLERRRQEAAE